MEVNIILAKCNLHNRSFGMRVEKINNDWLRTWAFKVNEQQAEKDGISADITLKGSFNVTESYPGCPHCGAYGFVRCSCGKLSCFGYGAESARCHWCNIIMDNIKTAETFDISSGKAF